MRKLIAGTRATVDGKIGGPDGYADWVPDWSDGYDLMQHVDAFILGGRNYASLRLPVSAASASPWSAVNDPGRTTLTTGHRVA